MDESFLGDSYDLVKRFLAQTLSPIAPIYADDFFIPNGIRSEFERITGIRMRTTEIARPFALFLDPCTGIPKTMNPKGVRTKTHVPLSYIAQVFEEHSPEFLICFDQSFSRNSAKEADITEKLDALAKVKLRGFYYVSHANFLIAANSEDMIRQIWKMLCEAGIPEKRLRR